MKKNMTKNSIRIRIAMAGNGEQIFKAIIMHCERNTFR